MGFDLNVSVPVLTVFVQGLLSFFSPCVLPLIPLYIGYLAGGTVSNNEEGEPVYNQKKVMLHTFFFVVGVSFAFFLLGFGMTAIGTFFHSKQTLIARIGGVIIVLFGMYQIGVFGQSAFLSKERKLPFRLEKMTMSPVTALIMGFTFSFAWTPCVGPALASVLLMTASASSQGMGFLLIGLYTLGFVIPFLLVGVFTTKLLSLFKKHRNVVKYSVKIGGILLILMGVLMIAGKMNQVSGFFSKLSAENTVVQEATTEEVSSEETSAEEIVTEVTAEEATAE
ncbi:MAG: cytochrome c biogenesis protein CcdA, partial [Eubacteriales bacterium]|nr:cytochrome c biogenesis protein CcdA [Eubacteriales bacterium]